MHFACVRASVCMRVHCVCVCVCVCCTNLFSPSDSFFSHSLFDDRFDVFQLQNVCKSVVKVSVGCELAVNELG